MKPVVFTCSDALRDAMADSVRPLAAYRELAGWRRHLGDNRLHQKALRRLEKDGSYDHWADELQDALTRLLCNREKLSPPLWKEAEALNQSLLAMATGHGNPVLYIRNLPVGLDGMLVRLGLLRMTTNAPEMGVESLKFDHHRMQGRTQMQKLHRDNDAAGVYGLNGIAVGQTPATTAFADTDEFIDEVARHYRFRRDGIANSVPLAPALRQQVVDLMCTGSPPLIQPDPAARPGQEWPKPYRMHPGFSGTQNYLSTDGHLDFAVKHALKSLKKGDGHVTGPGEVTFFNNDQVIHGVGKEVVDERARPGEQRHLLASYTRRHAVDEDGRTLLSSKIGTGR